MKLMVLTDIEGVTGITTYAQAEGTDYGREMLMHDLMAVIDTLNNDGPHDILVYDEHMDGRNVDLSRIPANVSVICGKPVETVVWRAESPVDGLIMVGFHGMAGIPGTLLPHSYFREHKKILINDLLVGEIGIEAALAGACGTPLILVTGDSAAEREAKVLVHGVETAVVKTGYGETEALCYSTAQTGNSIRKATAVALTKLRAGVIAPMQTARPVKLILEMEPSNYLTKIRGIGSGLFINETTLAIEAGDIIEAWEGILKIQKEALA